MKNKIIPLFLTLLFSLLLNPTHADWADLTITDAMETDHLCDVIPAPGGLTHDVYCAGNNPEILAGGVISTSSIDISGHTAATNVTGTDMDVSSAVSAAALYVNGNAITAGSGGSITVINPAECGDGEALVWVVSETSFLCPDSVAHI